MNEIIPLAELGIEYKDSQKFNLAITATKHAISFIPGVGGVLASVLGDIQQNRQLERYSDFIESLVSDLSLRIKDLEKSKIDVDGFWDVFELALRQSINNRHNDKRTAIKNIISNYLIGAIPGLDDAEYLMSLIIEFPIKHVIVVNDLSKFKTKPDPSDDEIELLYANLANSANVTEDDLYSILIDLENEGISRSFKSRYDTRRGNGGIFYSAGDTYLSDKGDRLIKAIHQMDSDSSKA